MNSFWNSSGKRCNKNKRTHFINKLFLLNPNESLRKCTTFALMEYFCWWKKGLGVFKSSYYKPKKESEKCFEYPVKSCDVWKIEVLGKEFSHSSFSKEHLFQKIFLEWENDTNEAIFYIETFHFKTYVNLTIFFCSFGTELNGLRKDIIHLEIPLSKITKKNEQ